ncbi:hypothetical protein Hanom_Chr15g01402241 [Helianthus anomalus]
MFVELISPMYVSCIFVDLEFLCIFQICKVKICVVTGWRSGNYITWNYSVPNPHTVS